MRLAPGTRLTGPQGRAVDETGRRDDGWTRASVPVENLDRAHDEFLRLGTAVEVLEPAELRERITRTVTELAARYAPRGGNSRAPCGD
ncbi:WYL domain-containing protein [Streptomyces heilongjiangensis]|uniref:WYL domain-containing protein n=1 Tax=Streptomyces heilongjiangensis TaxID=945052 RepID=A0ABW1B6L1_9ACTN